MKVSFVRVGALKDVTVRYAAQLSRRVIRRTT